MEKNIDLKFEVMCDNNKTLILICNLDQLIVYLKSAVNIYMALN